MTRIAARRGRALLVAGALAGLALAASDLMERRPSRAGELGPDVIALVNGQPISRAEYERALAGMASDRRSGRLDSTDRERVLDRVIAEELLVQRAIEMGLPARDRLVRAQLSGAVIGLLVDRAETAVDPPDEAVLRAFYRAHPEVFRTPGRIHLRQLVFRRGEDDDATARQRAVDARARWLAGDSFAEVSLLADEPTVPLADAPLPARVVRDRLGPTLATAAGSLEAGEVSPPLSTSTGYALIQVVSRDDGTVPPLEAIRPLVLAEYRRRAGELELAHFLAEARDRADIVLGDWQ